MLPPVMPPSPPRTRPHRRSLWLSAALLGYALWLVLMRTPTSTAAVPGTAWNLLAVTLALTLSGIRALVARPQHPHWHQALGALHTATLIAAFALFVWQQAWLALGVAVALLAVAWVAISRLPRPRA